MRTLFSRIVPVALVGLVAASAIAAGEDDLRFWLENMAWHHRYTIEEMVMATGLAQEQIEGALRKFDISPGRRPTRKPGDPLLVLPYPGGRHPRIGFLEGAINPMRGTKFSVFLPWPGEGYVVVDLPEAVWANGELIFLAHTHIPTVWDKKGQSLKNIDWTREPNGRLEGERTLPDGVAFGARVLPRRESVEMELWVRNGTDTVLTRLRAQVCIMLKGAPGFNAQTDDNKVTLDKAIAVRSKDGERWIATAWDHGKPWANPKVPCIHSDPHLPDCGAGKTVRARGRVFFHEGRNIENAIREISAP